MDFYDHAFFDNVYDRRDSKATKYELIPPSESEREMIPLWIADMDFKVAPPIEEALISVLRHGIFGYTEIDSEYYALVRRWFRRRFGWNFTKESILPIPGVVFGIASAVRALCDPNESVLICQPVYYPFANMVTQNGRRLIVSELVLKNGRYEMDFDDMERRIRENAVRVFLFCSPHNPGGRVWTREELLEVGRICKKYDVSIISDEIHCDFVFSEHPHIPIASLSEDLKNRVVTLTSPSKTFNLAGLQAANFVIPNKAIRRLVYRQCRLTGYSFLNVMAINATKAAYRDGEPWLKGLLTYLRESYSILSDAFSKDDPIALIPQEGTYLPWLDCRKMRMTDAQLKDFFQNKADLLLHYGPTFGAGGSGFVRMNIASPQVYLNEAIKRIKDALQQIQ